MTLALAMLGASFLLIMAMMSILWLLYFFQKNGGIVDIGWALGFILVALLFFVMSDGYWLRRLWLCGMVVIWAGRLGWHLFLRFLATEEDPRYRHLRKKLTGTALENFYLMFLFQGLLIMILSIGFLIVSLNRSSSFSILEGIGFVIWLGALIGETFADRQLTLFKQDPSNQGKICEKGLWYYSRHPNYFFEWLIWVGFFIFALASPFGWVAIISPVLMLYLLLFLSGIPLTEAESISSKGDDYRIYQKTTSAFVPWFKLKS